MNLVPGLSMQLRRPEIASVCRDEGVSVHDALINPADCNQRVSLRILNQPSPDLKLLQFLDSFLNQPRERLRTESIPDMLCCSCTGFAPCSGVIEDESHQFCSMVRIGFSPCCALLIWTNALFNF